MRPHGLAVDLNPQNDLRLGVIDGLDIDFAGALGRPIRQRHTVTLLGLEESDRTVGQIELDIDLIQEILAQDEGDLAAEISFARDQHPPILARELADLEFIDIDRFGIGLAAYAEYPITPGLPSGQAQPLRCRTRDGQSAIWTILQLDAAATAMLVAASAMAIDMAR